MAKSSNGNSALESTELLPRSKRLQQLTCSLRVSAAGDLGRGDRVKQCGEGGSGDRGVSVTQHAEGETGSGEMVGEIGLLGGVGGSGETISSG